MRYQVENLDEDHPARWWKESGDAFEFAEHLEELINLLMDKDLVPHSKLGEFEKDKTLGRFFGFLSELRAIAFFLSCGNQPELRGKHAFPDIVLGGKIGVEVKACIEYSTGNEILNLGRKPTKEELNKYVQRGNRKLLDILKNKSSKIADFEPFILFINTMYGGLEIHINDIKELVGNYFKEHPEISAIIIDDRYDLDGEKFSFSIFLNKEGKYPLPKKFLESMRLSGNLIKWLDHELTSNVYM